MGDLGAAGKFVEDYNGEWRVKKNGFACPRYAMIATLSKQAA